MSEFELIRRYFQPLDRSVRDGDGDGVDLGIGDDCALMQAPAGHQLAMSIDTLVEGVHFLADTDIARLGHKALAVNLSDLAAMGAQPLWYMLGLTLPKPDAQWLQFFSQGLSELASRAGIRLIGGDTTRGPCSITIQVTGSVPAGYALRRDGAKPGDDVYVSGVLGQGGLGLLVRQHQARDEIARDPFDPLGGAADTCSREWVDKLETPMPRLTLGAALRGIATACIDISDGFLQDLQHVLTASAVGACLDIDSLPVVSWNKPYAVLSARLSDPPGWRDYCLQCGDDYELCFTAPTSERARIDALAMRLDIRVTRVGQITEQPGLCTLGGKPVAPGGYQHF